VHALNQEDAGYLLAVGSTRLVQTLVQHDLVDEFRLMIDPVVAGGGKRVIADDGVLRPLRLADSSMATTGAILATHAPVSG
jgi:dihydrofolate reductase